MHIVIDIASQALSLISGTECVATYPVSTAAAGVGERKGSHQTPRGAHIIRAKIGADAPLNAVFVGRRPTGELYTPALGEEYPGRDWILTRILWLSGLEIGFNRLGDVDTMQRYIYIHGTPDEYPLSLPLSHGCIRMHNQDVVHLFNQVNIGTLVYLSETPVIKG